MKSLLKTILFALVALLFASCNGGDENWYIGEWCIKDNSSNLFIINKFSITNDLRFVDSESSCELSQDDKNKNVYNLVGEILYVRLEPSTKTLWLGAVGEGESGPFIKVEPKWYIGEWSNGKNSFVLTENTYDNPGLDHHGPVYITDSENTTGDVYIELDLPCDYGIEADTKHKTLVMKELGNGEKVISTYHKVKSKVKTENKETRKQPSPSVEEGNSTDDFKQEEIVFNRVDDVFNYLNKHTFKSESGHIIYIRPSGISLSADGKTTQITNAVRVSLNNEWSATVKANSPYGGSLTFIVNCNIGQVIDLARGGEYYYEQ